MQSLEAILNCLRKNYRRLLVVLPCGSGKTVIAANILPYIDEQYRGRVLFLVHRDELVFQAYEKFCHYNPSLRVEIEKAEYRADIDADVIIASVQSLSRRLDKYPSDWAKIIYIDECHHAVGGKQYISILEHFRALKGNSPDPEKIVIGITATPGRADSIGLEKIFDVIAYSRDIAWMIDNGWLTEVHGYSVWSDINISDVKITRGDFQESALSARVDTPERNKMIVENYLKLTPGLQALAFTVTIQHSHNVAKAFKDQGIPAEAVSGETPDKLRKQYFDLYREGKIMVLASAGVLTEGLDLPMASVALMARPTKSSLLYIQQVGRVLRPYPSPESRILDKNISPKEKAYVIDFVDNSGKHELIVLPTLFGLPRKFKLNGGSARSAQKALERLQLKYPRAFLMGASSLKEAEQMITNIDLLRPPQVPEDIKSYTKYFWMLASANCYRLGLPDNTALMIQQDLLGEYNVYMASIGIRKHIGAFKSLREAIAFADSRVSIDVIPLVLAKANWRLNAPTEKQLKMLYVISDQIKQSFSHMSDWIEYANRKFNRGDLRFSRGGVSSMIDAIMSHNLAPHELMDLQPVEEVNINARE